MPPKSPKGGADPGQMQDRQWDVTLLGGPLARKLRPQMNKMQQTTDHDSDEAPTSPEVIDA